MYRLFFITLIFLVSFILFACTEDGPKNTAGALTVSAENTVGETITATLTDDNGLEGLDVVFTFTVGSSTPVTVTDTGTGNTATATFVLPDSVGQTVSIEASYTDGDGFAYEEGGLPVRTVTSAAIVVNTAGELTVSAESTVGETITATLTDDNGLEGLDVVFTFTVGSSTPVTVTETGTGNTATATFVLPDSVGQTVSIEASYTDEDGFAYEEGGLPVRTVTSAAIVVNTAGTLTVSAESTVGETITATLTDENGLEGLDVVFTFTVGSSTPVTVTESGTGNTAVATFVLPNNVGETVSIEASYTDGDGFVYEDGGLPVRTATSEVIVATAPTNTAGALTVSAESTVGETITATLIDENGLEGLDVVFTFTVGSSTPVTVTEAGTGNTATATFVLPDSVGETVSITASYTDGDGFVYEDGGLPVPTATSEVIVSQ